MMFISKSLKKINSSKIEKLQLLHETGKIMFEGHQRSQLLGLRNCFSVYTTRKFNIGNLKYKCSCCNQPDKFKITDAGGRTVFYVEAANFEIKHLTCTYCFTNWDKNTYILMRLLLYITDDTDGIYKATTSKKSKEVHLTYGDGQMSTFQKVLLLLFSIVIYNQPGKIFTKETNFSIKDSCKKCVSCGCYIVVATVIIFSICIAIMLALLLS